MSVAAILLTASALLLPSPGTPVGEQLFQRVQGRVEAENTWVMVTLNLWVDPNGRILECSIGRVVGNPKISEGFCSNLIGSVIESPRDELGQPTHAFVNFSTSAFGSGLFAYVKPAIQHLISTPNSTDPDYQIPIASRSISEINEYAVDVVVGADGLVTSCEKSKRKTKAPNRVVVAACAQARRKTFQIRRGSSGEAVAYVRSVTLVSGT